MRTSTSSSSLTLRSCSIARRRVFMSWLATAARPVSSSPESTRSVRSSSSVFTWGSSLLALPLPPFDAARRRFSAFLGSCQKQYSCGGSTVTVHLPPSRFIPAHVAVKYAPPLPSRGSAVGAGATIIRLRPLLVPHSHRRRWSFFVGLRSLTPSRVEEVGELLIPLLHADVQHPEHLLAVGTGGVVHDPLLFSGSLWSFAIVHDIAALSCSRASRSA